MSHPCRTGRGRAVCRRRRRSCSSQPMHSRCAAAARWKKQGGNLDELEWIVMPYASMVFFFEIGWVNRCKQFIGLTNSDHRTPTISPTRGSTNQGKIRRVLLRRVAKCWFPFAFSGDQARPRRQSFHMRDGTGRVSSMCTSSASKGWQEICFSRRCFPCFLSNVLIWPARHFLGAVLGKNFLWFPAMQEAWLVAVGSSDEYWISWKVAWSAEVTRKWATNCPFCGHVCPPLEVEEFRRQQRGSFWGYGCYGIAASCWWFATVFSTDFNLFPISHPSG